MKNPNATPYAITVRDSDPKLQLVVGNHGWCVGSDGKTRRCFTTQSVRLSKRQALHLANSLLQYAAR